jgi:hypothetical protein
LECTTKNRSRHIVVRSKAVATSCPELRAESVPFLPIRRLSGFAGPTLAQRKGLSGKKRSTATEARRTFCGLQRVIIDDKDDWYGFPERVDTRWLLGLASSYAAIARSSYRERLFEIIELVMVNDNFLVESLDETHAEQQRRTVTDDGKRHF